MTLENLLAILNSITAAPDFLPKASLVMATIAAFFATLACLRARRTGGVAALSKFDAMQLLRTETDTLKADGDERERRMVTGLANLTIDRAKDFSARIDRFISQIDGRAETLAQKFNGDLAQLGADAIQHRDAVRRLVEEKLADAIAKQAAMAREFREELGAGFLNLGRGTSATLEQSSEQQKERLDEVKKAIERNIELQGKAQEALRLAVESRLDAIRLESSAKLEEMRSTLDEKLQVALEARLHQSFSRIVEQLSKVYEQIGEMKTLATTANGHFPVPAELSAPKETFAP